METNNIATGQIVQNSTVDVYSPGAEFCSCDFCDPNIINLQIRCNGCDYAFEEISCCNSMPGCTNQVLCTGVDPSACPVIAGNNGIATWATGTGGVCIAATLNCGYPTNIFKNPEDITQWIVKFGNNESLNDTIMPAFCQVQSTDCPINPETGSPMSACSNFKDQGLAGDMCRSWASNNPTLFPCS